MTQIVRATNGLIDNQVTTVRIPTANVLGLRANPFPLVPAVSSLRDRGSQSIIGPIDSTNANYIIVPTMYAIRLLWNSVAYTVANTAIQLLLVGTGMTPAVATPAIFTATANRIQVFSGSTQTTAVDWAAIQNQPLTLANTGAAEFLAGNSDILVDVYYSVLRVS